MLLIDFSQLAIASTAVCHQEDYAITSVRHRVWLTLGKYRKLFFKTYGDPILCCDSASYWRKQLFPSYKAARAAKRATSNTFSNACHYNINTMREEFKQNSPYLVLTVEGAEADDIIAVLTANATEGFFGRESVLCVSGDKDFGQLAQYNGFRQYSPRLKDFVMFPADLDKALAEHIFRGDKSDGIPNILSDDDTFITPGKKQKSLSKTLLDTYTVGIPADLVLNYARNNSLINFKMIPSKVQNAILDEWRVQIASPKTRQGLLSYFMHHRLNSLIPRIGDF